MEQCDSSETRAYRNDIRNFGRAENEKKWKRNIYGPKEKFLLGNEEYSDFVLGADTCLAVFYEEDFFGRIWPFESTIPYLTVFVALML